MSRMVNKVNIITLGCSKNLVDSENLLGELKARGVDVLHESEEACDHVIINTCGFIGDAKEESINTILRYAVDKKKGIIKKLFVTGCLSQRYARELRDEIHEVDGFYGTEDIPAILKDLGFDPRKDLIGERVITTPSHYAYLKISEGCDRKCSFCAIPLIRGRHRSRTPESLLEEARFLASKGVKEIILIAQDLTWYGIDLYKKQYLASLLRSLSDVDGIEWLRLHYAYPAAFPDDVLEVMRERTNICNYLDIPLQHISDPILKSMKRSVGSTETYRLIEKIRKMLPDAALRTTMLVGYPGETENDFKQLLKFVEESRFDRLGVFTYSEEDGTSAAKLPDNIPHKVKVERMEALLGLQQNISLELNEQKIGKTFKTLIDKKEGDYMSGRTEYDSPEVDNEVIIRDPGLEIGEFYNIHIESASEFDLLGKKLNSP
ncbi:MAG: 30S ribosomal protein S12 methylthiotransferase RimO [Bacteroidales bacterium]|nr:30S ribosomal protein S12 methylthiotransferase RimO [Bacteroidales bacterium]